MAIYFRVESFCDSSWIISNCVSFAIPESQKEIKKWSKVRKPAQKFINASYGYGGKYEKTIQFHPTAAKTLPDLPEELNCGEFITVNA